MLPDHAMAIIACLRGLVGSDITGEISSHRYRRSPVWDGITTAISRYDGRS